MRLNLVVEGQTEEMFVKRVLCKPLASRNIFVSPRSVETSRNKRANKIYRGGLTRYLKLKNDLIRWMNEDQNSDVRFSTMIDLFRLPNDFPGYEETTRLNDPCLIVKHLEQAFFTDINEPRFIPYIQMHEFEALLLSDPSKFELLFPLFAKEINELARMVADFDSPELINQGSETAPSKRIIGKIPEYERQKAHAGPIIARNIGLETIRQRCPHFNEWMKRLETLGANHPVSL